MTVGIKVKFYWYQIGSGDFLHAFFSNICYHLEGGTWGSVYPYIMNSLYKGLLPHLELKKAVDELEQIRVEFEKIPVDRVIWDIDNLGVVPSWEDDISSDITNLSNYFVTSEGEDLIQHIISALKKADKLGCDAKLESL
jgi:hypothetical protein